MRKEIQAGAPERTGAYAKLDGKNRKETSHTLELTVHSKNRYQLAHLLEFRKSVAAVEYPIRRIAPAEELGIKELENAIQKALRG